MGTPFFSVVVPCYNRAGILLATIEAILKQTWTDFELILIDDGSRDYTREVIAGIVDPRVSYYFKENGERGAARNFGARLARGKYINFFDCDDEMYPNHLQSVRDFVDQNGQVEVAHTGYERLDEQGRLLGEIYEFTGSTNDALLKDNPLACNTVFVRRDIALANPFTEDRRLASAEDWELWLRLASKYPFHAIRQKTFCLREHDNRSLNTIAPETVKVRDELFAELVRQNPDFGRRFPRQLSRFVADRYTFITLTMALSKHDRLNTLRYLWKAVQEDPTVLWRRRFLASIKHLL